MSFILRRLGAIVPTLFFVSVMIFGLQQLLPGDTAIAMAGEERDPNVVAYLRGVPLTSRFTYVTATG
jgi:peptide/nickel transport system permease protein